MNGARPSKSHVVWWLVVVPIAGGLFIGALAVRAYVSGRITLTHSVVTEVDNPFFFYTMTGLFGLIAILMIRAGALIAIQQLRKPR